VGFEPPVREMSPDNSSWNADINSDFGFIKAKLSGVEKWNILK
jgi:hypothetical protein